MTTWDGELLEKIFSVFAKKNKNDNLGLGTLGDAFIFFSSKMVVSFLLEFWKGAPSSGLVFYTISPNSRLMAHKRCVALYFMQIPK